jgi:hypothetical protein
MHLTPAHTSIPAHDQSSPSSLSLHTQAVALPDSDRDPPGRQPTAAAVMDPYPPTCHPLALPPSHPPDPCTHLNTRPLPILTLLALTPHTGGSTAGLGSGPAGTTADGRGGDGPLPTHLPSSLAQCLPPMHLTPAHTSIPAHYQSSPSSLSLHTQAAALPDSDRDPPGRQPTAAAVMDPYPPTCHPLSLPPSHPPDPCTLLALTPRTGGSTAGLGSGPAGTTADGRGGNGPLPTHLPSSLAASLPST